MIHQENIRFKFGVTSQTGCGTELGRSIRARLLEVLSIGYETFKDLN
jgi:hypothetical protein